MYFNKFHFKKTPLSNFVSSIRDYLIFYVTVRGWTVKKDPKYTDIGSYGVFNISKLDVIYKVSFKYRICSDSTQLRPPLVIFFFNLVMLKISTKIIIVTFTSNKFRMTGEANLAFKG